MDTGADRVVNAPGLLPVVEEVARINIRLAEELMKFGRELLPVRRLDAPLPRFSSELLACDAPELGIVGEGICSS